jgi:hypothetical protein
MSLDVFFMIVDYLIFFKNKSLKDSSIKVTNYATDYATDYAIWKWIKVC